MQSTTHKFFFFLICILPMLVSAQKISAQKADWGIWIENGLVNPGEAVRMIVSLPINTPKNQLPTTLQVHPRYLEEKDAKPDHIPLKWKTNTQKKQWLTSISYTAKKAGNYYAAIQFNGRELFSYFAAWQSGLTVVNFWMTMPVEFHDANNLDDIYLPDVKSGHLPIDYELVLVGEKIFKDNWKPRELFRQAQIETGAEIIPFFDGGYFHKTAPELTERFNSVKDKIGGYESLVSEETRKVHGLNKLPDPTFHSITVEQATSVIKGAQRYWEHWGFRPFTGVGTYSPSNTLVQSCRNLGLSFISGVFSDYDFSDGLERWQGGWRQKHRGMPSFPYKISPVDFRISGNTDLKSPIMFAGWQTLPVWEHEDKHGYGTDPSSYNDYNGKTITERMLLFSEVFERNNQIANNKFPMVETFCIQMNHQANRPTMASLVDRARQGKLIFIHKRYLYEYYKAHKINLTPDLCYTTPDAKISIGRKQPYHFNYATVWEGADGKAAFISEETAPLEKGRSIYIPVWWYDYRSTSVHSPLVNLPSVDLSGLSIQPEVDGQGKSLIIKTQKAYERLPICLWDLGNFFNPSEAWKNKYRAMKVAAPEKFGEQAYMWIIRPDISVGKNVIPLK